MRNFTRDAVPESEREALDNELVEDLPGLILALRVREGNQRREATKAHAEWTALSKLYSATGATIEYLKARLEDEL